MKRYLAKRAHSLAHGNRTGIKVGGKIKGAEAPLLDHGKLLLVALDHACCDKDCPQCVFVETIKPECIPDSPAFNGALVVKYIIFIHDALLVNGGRSPRLITDIQLHTRQLASGTCLDYQADSLARIQWLTV